MAEFGIGSDYKVEVSFTDDMGVAIDPLSVKWELAFFVHPSNKAVTASYDGTILQSCKQDGNKIVCGFDVPPFTPGAVKCRQTLYFDDNEMPDGVQKVVKVVKTGDMFV